MSIKNSKKPLKNQRASIFDDPKTLEQMRQNQLDNKLPSDAYWAAEAKKMGTTPLKK